MTSATVHRRRSAGRRAVHRRRRVAAVLGVAVLAALTAGAVLPSLDRAVKEVTLPLRHEDVIRQQAADKGLDPALVAAVIYAESKFRDATSHAGARGLMQITPATAETIARRSGGVAFEQGDLASPQINIAYGTYHLRWLLRHYGGNELLAVAAYNAGEGNVDRWLARHGPGFRPELIPFPETRAYVQRVFHARRSYRREYRAELGL